SEEEKRGLVSLTDRMIDPTIPDKNGLLARLGELCSRTDDFDPIAADLEVIELQYDVHRQVWSEVEGMRSSGRLLEMGRQIRCAVVAIHGDYDPHPAEGVREPLSRVLRDFRFILLPKCGHEPWIERQAKDDFYRILRQELEQEN
ncbi:MAG TPA: alpha/beta hydrolase, partial [Chloroflexota bacterium]|nr:alpha/beta hydrolase [Chloroflexota bacterium]